MDVILRNIFRIFSQPHQDCVSDLSEFAALAAFAGRQEGRRTEVLDRVSEGSSGSSSSKHRSLYSRGCLQCCFEFVRMYLIGARCIWPFLRLQCAVGAQA